MIRKAARLKRFYRSLEAKEKSSYKKALAIFEALRREAFDLGALGHDSILDGFEVDLRMARIIHSLKA